jgi:DNA repair photolyase
MALVVREVRVASILTRTSGYLRSVCSHSLQPYRGCSYGRSLCGVACYVQHNGLLTRGEPWGSFLEARVDAAARYREQAARERRWGRRARGAFAIFLSSSTDPFVPQEQRLGITRSVLRALCDDPPDALILQSHSHLAAGAREPLLALSARCRVRVHLSVESDRDRLPGLPPPASPVERRLAAAAELRRAGLRVVVTVSPLLPIARPREFFERISDAADACVVDHYIGGDGSADGSRTARTALPAAMARVEPDSTDLAYRDRMVAVAREVMPGRVGVGADGFAGRLLPG